MTKCSVSSVADLLAAVGDPDVRWIEVAQTLHDVPPFRLGQSQILQNSQSSEVALYFADGSDAVCLTRDNTVRGLCLYASPSHRVLWNDSSVASLGVIVLSGLKVTGQVQLLARDNVCGGHVIVEDLDIEAADTRARMERPHAYGVSALQGAFTLWNQQTDATVVVSCACGISRQGEPLHPYLGAAYCCAAQELRAVACKVKS